MMLRLENIDLTEVHVTFKGNREVTRGWEEKKSFSSCTVAKTGRQEVGLLKTEIGRHL